MDQIKSKSRFSIIGVSIIFLLVYLGELAIGAAIFFYVVIPKIEEYQQTNLNQQIADRQQESPEKAETYRLFQQMSKEMVQESDRLTKLLDDKKYQELIDSITSLQPSLKNDDDRVFVNLLLAQVYSAQADHQNIGVAADNLIKYGPNYSFGYRFKSEYYLAEKNYPEALVNARRAAGLDSNQAYNHYLFSIALYSNNQFPEALSEIQRAIIIDPNNSEYEKELELQQKETIPQTVKPTKSTGPGYTNQDIDNLVNDLDFADQDYSDIQTFIGSPTYNQEIVNEVIRIIPQRKALAQKLLDKMGKNLPLTQADFATWDQYRTLSSRQNSLVTTLHNSNGGF